MKRIERPRIEGKPLSFREKLGALVSGKPVHAPGTFAYFEEDFADPLQDFAGKRSERGDPLAMARRMSRIFKSDHEKLDKLDNVDSLYNEMDYDSIVGGARNRYEEALQTAKLSIETDPAYLDYCERVTKPGSPLMIDLTARMVDAETRGFCLGEWTVDRMTRGDYAGYDTIGSISRKERDAYRLEEDEFSRPAALEIWVVDTASYRKDQITGRSRFIGGTVKPQQQVVIKPGDPDWERFLFLTYPERGNRVAGLSRYGAAFPWYHFLIHLRQWMMTCAERCGTPILVAEFMPQGSMLSDKYQITADEMFTVLEKIQTNFRGVIPSGFTIKPVDTGFEGIAPILRDLALFCWQMIELAVMGEIVSGGAQAQGGTLGANQTVINTTFGGHVASGHRRIAGRLSRILEYLIELNFGKVVDVECSFDAVDPVKESAKIANAEKGIALGAISKHEPWVRDLLGAPMLDDQLLSETQTAKLDAERYGLVDKAVTDAPASDVGSTDDVLEIIDRVQDGDIGEALAATLLAPKLGVTVDEAARVVKEERARRAPAGTVAVASSGGAPAGEDTVQDLALNGAQVTSLQGMLAAVQDSTLAPEAAVLAILTAFPSIPEQRARAMVAAQAGLPKPQAEPQVQPDKKPEGFSDTQAAVNRMRGAMRSLRTYIKRDYNTSNPPPIKAGLAMAMGAFVGMSNREERVKRADRLRTQIQDALAVALDGVQSDEDALARFDEVAEFFCLPEVMEEYR